MALLGTVEDILKLLSSLSIEVDLWKAQNTCFSIGRGPHKEIDERAEKGDDGARSLNEVFHQVCSHIRVNIP